MATKKTAAESKKAPAKKITATVTGGRLNVRKEASLAADVVRVLDDGSVIDIKEKGAEWSQAKDGYVMTKYLVF